MENAIPYDSAQYLDTEDAIAEYVAVAFETEDPAFIAQALGTVARARSMTRLAQQIGMSRPALYRALSGADIRSSPPSPGSCTPWGCD